MSFLALPLLLACSTPSPEPITPPVVVPHPTVPRPDPAALYASCRGRVELPEAAGECATDADCASGGCSGEVCTTRAAGLDLASGCEVLDCFDVLDRCGCHDGVCAWTVRSP